MRILLTIILSFSINIFGDDHMSQKEMNLKVVNTFWDNILTENYQVALDTLHEDLEFEFMGICSICKKYNRETYESEWFMGVIPAVLPNGIEITKVKSKNNKKDKSGNAEDESNRGHWLLKEKKLDETSLPPNVAGSSHALNSGKS